MKKLFVVFFIALFSCGQEEVTVKTNALIGEWSWVRKTGGIAGIDEKPKAGENAILKLNADYSYSYLNNGVTISSGTYTLERSESMLLNKEVPFIVFDKNNKRMYEIKKDRLYLSDDLYDGFNFEYVRIK